LSTAKPGDVESSTKQQKNHKQCITERKKTAQYKLMHNVVQALDAFYRYSGQ